VLVRVTVYVGCLSGVINDDDDDNQANITRLSRGLLIRLAKKGQRYLFAKQSGELPKKAKTHLASHPYTIQYE